MPKKKRLVIKQTILNKVSSFIILNLFIPTIFNATRSDDIAIINVTRNFKIRAKEHQSSKEIFNIHNIIKGLNFSLTLILL